MILVDTSVWIDHLHRADPRLIEALEVGNVGCHPLVIEELALGSLKRRAMVSGLLEDLAGFSVMSHAEASLFVGMHRLWGRGLSAVDAHLLGSVRLRSGGRLWTRDRRLRAAAADLGVDVV